VDSSGFGSSRFPAWWLEGEGHAVRGSGTGGGSGWFDGSFETEGAARTLRLAIPKELDLREVETINIDQTQGATRTIWSVRQGKIFILCYE